MTTEQSLAAAAVFAWTQQITRATTLFDACTDEQLQIEIAPGKNRLIYLLGHLTAVHDGMLPLLGIGARQCPELDAPFLSEADRAVADVPPAAELRRQWTTVNGQLATAFASFTAADWAQKHTAVSDADFAVNPLRNRMAVLLSRTSHVAYHLGQVVLAPK